MEFTQPNRILTDAAVLKMLEVAVATAEGMGQPQCIVIVDASGELLGEIRMTGAKFLSRKSARSKARTAASIRSDSGSIPDAMRDKLAFATQGEVTALLGGMPISIDGHHMGGIGVGSGAPQQDIDVATAALKAIGADL